MTAAMVDRCRRGLLAVAWMASLAATPSAAEVLELPVERRLDAQASVREIGVVLRHAAIEIVVDPEAQPRLRARRLAAWGNDPQPAAVAPAIRWGERGGVIEIARAESADRPEIPVRVELTVNAAERVWLRGSDLDLSIRRALPAAPATAAEEPGEHGAPGVAPAPPWLELDLERSDVYLLGIPGARVTATGGALIVERTRGGLSLTAAAADAEIRGHLGDLSLRGEDSEFYLLDHRGDLDLELQASELVVANGQGACRGRADDGRVRLEGWRGRGELTGDGAAVEVRQSGAPLAGSSPEAPGGTSLTLAGRGLEVLVDQYRGTLDATLDGGSLRGGAVAGSVEITARSRAIVRLAELAGEVRLSLAGGATAEMTDVPDKLLAEVDDGRLEAGRVGNLNLLATGAEIFVSGLRRLGRLQAVDSRLELDLVEITHDPAIILKGSSRAHVRLPLPCEVRVVEPGEAIPERADVSGCELRTRSYAGDRLEASPRVEGAVKLVASVPAASTLTVEGVPVP